MPAAGRSAIRGRLPTLRRRDAAARTVQECVATPVIWVWNGVNSWNARVLWTYTPSGGELRNRKFEKTRQFS
jgi:hypothetical protein